MWYILRYILIRTGNRRPEALSEVAITRCVYAVLHGVSFFFFSFPFFHAKVISVLFRDSRSNDVEWAQERREVHDVQKERSIVVVPPSSLSNRSIPHYSRKPRGTKRWRRKKKKKEMTACPPPVFYFFHRSSFPLVSFLFSPSMNCSN